MTTSYPRSLYGPLIDDGERIRNDLMTCVNRLQSAIETVKQARSSAKEAQDALASAEADYVVEAIVLAESGQGPLAGIAKTSKAYQFALDNLLAKARQNGLSVHAHSVRVTQNDLLDAEIAYEQAMAKFSALKHAADLQAAMINGIRA